MSKPATALDRSAVTKVRVRRAFQQTQKQIQDATGDDIREQDSFYAKASAVNNNVDLTENARRCWMRI